MHFGQTGPDWRLVLVHQATPKTAKITLERSIRRLLILSSVHLHTQEFVSRNENRKRSFGTAGNLVATDFRKVYLTF